MILSMPCSNASSERAFSIVKNIKTNKRNSLRNLTISSLMRIKNWLKTQSFTASNAVISQKMISTVQGVKSNAPINSYVEHEK